MGLILDSSVAIAGERGGLPVEGMLAVIREASGSTDIALSVVSVMELEHGVWRAKETSSRPAPPVPGRPVRNVPVYPITVELARRAGRIDAEQQAVGIRIAFQDLLIGVSA